MNKKVPEGWSLSSVDEILTIKRGITYIASELCDEQSGNPLYVNMKSFIKDGGYNVAGEKYFGGSYQDRELANYNELFIANTDVTPTGDIIGAPALIPKNRWIKKTLCSHHVSRLIIKKSTYNEYLYYLFCSDSIRSFMKQIGRGTTVKMLDNDAFKKLELVLPSLPEQQKIATILSSVDNVIEKTRAQIDKLKDLKTGMMQELLTKGIGHTEFKDSPVGVIPADWSVVEIGEIALQVKPGPFGSSLTKAMYVSSGYKVYGQEQVISGDFKVGDYYIDQAKYDELSAFKVSGGDVLISLVGTFGQIAVVPEDFQCGIINPRLLIIRFPLSLVNTEFIAQQLKSDYVLNQLKQLQQGGTMGVLSATTVKPVKLIIPPIEQQRLIGQAMKSVDKSILAKEAQLESTKNTKKALMQDLLTGKVRVNLTDKESAVV